MFVFKPTGVCPTEIHFTLQDHRIGQLRMVGGGCTGNSELVARLLEGRAVDEVLPLLAGIVCRNGTSCPDQLAAALKMAETGQLEESDPITIHHEEQLQFGTLALIAEVNGNVEGLRKVLADAAAAGAEAVFHVGNLVGPHGDNDATVELACKQGVKNVQGPRDRQAAGCAVDILPAEGTAELERLKPKNRDRLVLQPLIWTFGLGPRKGVVFHGNFIQSLKGFSDFSPYATEVLMTCNLSDYLRDESVFPALATMTEHFLADLVVFGHTGQWNHVQLSRVDFINVGALAATDQYSYGLLTWNEGALHLQVRTLSR